MIAAPRTIWPHKPKIDAQIMEAVELYSTDELRRLHDAATAKNVGLVNLLAGIFSREEIKEAILWRARRERRGYLLLLALWLIGVAATVTVAAAGWYVGTP